MRVGFSSVMLIYSNWRQEFTFTHMHTRMSIARRPAKQTADVGLGADQHYLTITAEIASLKDNSHQIHFN